MANARGRGKPHPHSKSSPAHVAALIGGAALLLLLGVKLIGILNSEAGRGLLARTGGTVQGWLGRFVTIGSGPDDVPASAGLEAALEPLGIEPAAIGREVTTEVGTGRRLAERWEVTVPRRVSLVQVNLAVTQAAPEIGLRVLDAWEESHSGGPALRMTLGQAGAISHRLHFRRSESSETGVVAIIVTGFGKTWDDATREFLDFPASISLAVLPGYRGSRKIADAARRRGFEVLLALPMEPLNYPAVAPGPEAILVDQKPAEIRAHVRRALRSVGKVAGISSYMGSRATTDKDVMEVVLDETRDRQLFFVDNRTADRPVTRDLARELGTVHLVSNLWLDGERPRSRGVVARRLADMIEIAERTGEALAFAHGHPETLAALEEVLPELEARGLKLVPASSLTRTQLTVRTQAGL